MMMVMGSIAREYAAAAAGDDAEDDPSLWFDDAEC